VADEGPAVRFVVSTVFYPNEEGPPSPWQIRPRACGLYVRTFTGLAISKGTEPSTKVWG
jgi:hypothetical protein